MLDAQFEYSAANQPVVLTPFLLMGAMSPVSIPATLAQQMAEALTGIALSQLIRPGCPVIFGSFLSNIDMQSGSPQFGTPESAVGLLCTGQIARHFGLPVRSGGGLTSSQVPDAQAAYEGLMTMLPTFLAGINWVMHTRGLARRRPGRLLREVRRRHADPRDAPGGVHPAGVRPRRRSPSARTRRSATAGTSSGPRTPWSGSGPASTGRSCRPRTTTTAGCAAGPRTPPPARRTCGGRSSPSTSSPPMDEAVREELEAYVTRRRAELGD